MIVESAVAGAGREDRAVGAARGGREQAHELLHRDLFLVNAREHGHDVARDRGRHGRADRRDTGFPGCRWRAVASAPCFDEQVLGQGGDGDRERLGHRAGQQVAGDVADTVGAGVQQGDRVEVVGQRSPTGRERDLFRSRAARSRVEIE